MSRNKIRCITELGGFTLCPLTKQVPGLYSHRCDYVISTTTVSFGHYVFFAQNAQNYASWGCLCRCAFFTFETTNYVDISQNLYWQIHTKRHKAHLTWLVPIKHNPLKYMISKSTISSLKNGSPYETLVYDMKYPIKYYKFCLKHCVISAYLTKQDGK